MKSEVRIAVLVGRMNRVKKNKKRRILLTGKPGLPGGPCRERRSRER